MSANDSATLRQTVRSQIISPQDLDNVDEVLTITANVSDAKLEAYLRDADRTYTLSSDTKAEQNLVRDNKDSRDVTGKLLYDREPGRTKGVSPDFGVEQATLMDELGSKNIVLGRKTDAQGNLTNRFRRKRGDELPEIVQAEGFYTGGFAPPTRGHRGAFDTLLENVIAKNPNATIKDILVSVAPNVAMVEGKEGLAHAARYGIFDADLRSLLADINFKGAMVSSDTQPTGGILPKVMEVPGENNRRKFARLKGAMAVTSGKEKGALGKYDRAGIQVTDIPRIEDISATTVRELLFSQNYAELDKIVNPEVGAILKGNQPQLKNRSVMVPVLLEEINKIAEINKILANQKADEILANAPGGPYTNISKKLKAEHPDIAAQVKSIRDERDAFKKSASGAKSHSIIRELASTYPEIYGIDPSRRAATTASTISAEDARSHLGDRVKSLLPEGTEIPEPSLLESIKQNVIKQLATPKGAGTLPTDSKTITRTFLNMPVPSDPTFGMFSGKSIDSGMVNKVWRQTYPGLSEDKTASYTAVKEWLESQYNVRTGAKTEELSQAIQESKMVGLVGMLPIGHEKLSGPFTWALGKNAAGDDVSVTASIIERGLGKKYEEEIKAAQQHAEQGSELLASGLSSKMKKPPTSLRSLDKGQLETLGQGNIEGAYLEQGLARLWANLDNVSTRTRPIDYPDGLGESAELFPGISPTMPTEVKRTINSDSRTKAIEEFQRYFRLINGVPEPKAKKEAVQALSVGGTIERFAAGGNAQELSKYRLNSKENRDKVNLDNLMQDSLPSMLYSGFKTSRRGIIEQGLDKSKDYDPKELVNKTFTMPSYLSTSATERGGRSFGDVRGGLLHIATASQKKGIDVVRNLGNGAAPGLYEREAEFILPKQSSFKINDVLTNKGPLGWNKDWSPADFLELGVQQLAAGGKASRGVDIDKEFMANPVPSPFNKAVSKKLGPEVYDLEKSSGLSSFEFDETKRLGDAAGDTIEQFKTRLAERAEAKKQRSQIKTNPSDMAKQLMSERKPLRPDLKALADSLQDTSNNIGYRPSALERIAQARSDINNATRGFAVGGEVEGSSDLSNWENVQQDSSFQQAIADFEGLYGRSNVMNRFQFDAYDKDNSKTPKIGIDQGLSGASYKVTPGLIEQKGPEYQDIIANRVAGYRKANKVQQAAIEKNKIKSPAQQAAEDAPFIRDARIQKALEAQGKGMREYESRPRETDYAQGGFRTRKFAEGGVAGKEKNYGKIILKDGNSQLSGSVSASYLDGGGNGEVVAHDMGSGFYSVASSSATSGYGPRLYDVVMESVTQSGKKLVSDRSRVSNAAKRVWEYYLQNRGDVNKTPITDISKWYTGSQLDMSKFTSEDPKTWPPYNDISWALNTAYSKSPKLINDEQTVQRFAIGGSIPALVSNGEGWVPPEQVASFGGYGALDQMNQADRNGMGRYSEGGGIGVFRGPGGGTSDKIRANLAVGGYVVRERAMKALGFNKGGTVGVQKFEDGGKVYKYVAIDATTGKEVRNTVKAANKEEAEKKLRAEALMVVSLKVEKESLISKLSGLLGFSGKSSKAPSVSAPAPSVSAPAPSVSSVLSATQAEAIISSDASSSSTSPSKLNESLTNVNAAIGQVEKTPDSVLDETKTELEARDKEKTPPAAIAQDSKTATKAKLEKEAKDKGISLRDHLSNLKKEQDQNPQPQTKQNEPAETSTSSTGGDIDKLTEQLTVLEKAKSAPGVNIPIIDDQIAKVQQEIESLKSGSTSGSSGGDSTSGSSSSTNLGPKGLDLQEKQLRLKTKVSQKDELVQAKDKASTPEEQSDIDSAITKISGEMMALVTEITSIEDDFKNLGDTIDEQKKEYEEATNASNQADSEWLAARKAQIEAQDALTAAIKKGVPNFDNLDDETKRKTIDEVSRTGQLKDEGGNVVQSFKEFDKVEVADVKVKETEDKAKEAKKNWEAASTSLQQKRKDQKGQFGDINTLADVDKASSSNFVSQKQSQIDEQNKRKSELESKVSGATGGEKAILNDQIKATDSKIKELEDAIEAAKQAYLAVSAEVDNQEKRVAEASAATKTAEEDLDKAYQGVVDALRAKIKNFDQLSVEEQAVAVEQVAKTGKVRSLNEKGEITADGKKKGTSPEIIAAGDALREAQTKVETSKTSETDAKVASEKTKIEKERLNPDVKEAPPSSPRPPTVIDQLYKEENDKYNDNQFFEYKGRKEGTTAKGYKLDIARKLGAAAYETSTNYEGKKQEMSYELAGKMDTFQSIGKTIESGTDQEKGLATERLNKEIEAIAKEIKTLNPSIENADDAAREMANAMQAGNLAEAQKVLIDTLGKAPEGPEAMKMAMDQLAKQLGISRDILERNFGEGGLEGKEVKRQQFIQSKEGKRYGALAEYAPDMLSKFSGTGAGKALGGGADFISGKGGKFSQLFNKMGGLATAGAALSVAAEKFKTSVTVTNPNTAGIVGGIGGAGTGLASGAVLGAQVAGPIGALIAGVGGAIIGGITGAFDAFNAKRLENNIKLVETSASDLNVALKKLAENASETNATLVNAKSTKLLQDSGDLREQASFGSGGMARSTVEFLRAYDPTGISNSVTGGTVEKEARDAFVSQTLVPYVDAQSSLGDVRRNKISTDQLQEVRTTIDDRSKAAAATKDPAKIAAAEKLNREDLLKSSQTVRQLIAPVSQGGKGHNLDEALITMGMTQRKKEGKDYEKDSKTAEGKAKLREEGAKLAAQEEDSKNRTLLLSRAMREMSIETDHLIETYRRAAAYITRFGDELEAFDIQLNNNVSALKGQASVGPVDRSNEKILGNLSGYSKDEVKGAADRVAQLAGGGKAGTELGQQVQMNKVLQDELPQILKGATAENINEGDNSVMSQIKEALSVVGEPPKALLDEIENKLRDKTAGKDGGTSLSDVGDDTSGFINSLKAAQAATNLSIALTKQYNDALQKTVGYTNEYAKALQEAADYQMQAKDVRLKGEIQLKETLGQRMSLDEVNAPQETRIKSLTKGGTLDPGMILRDMNNDINSKKANEEELAKRAMKASESGAQPDIAAFEQQAKLVADQNNSINNSRKALEELAKDSSGASNALKGLAEQQKSSRASVNFLQKVFTSDAGQLQEMNKGLAAYTKVISGKASGKEMNNLQFRQQAFSGLESISGMMPDSVKNQMQGRLIKNMAASSPQLMATLQQKTGYTYTGADGTVKEATYMDSLDESITGKSKAQDEYINAYKEATSRQADAADKLGIAAMSVADTFKTGMTDVLAKIKDGLLTAVPTALADTKLPPTTPAPLDVDPALVYSINPDDLQKMKEALNIKDIPLIWPDGADKSVNQLIDVIGTLTKTIIAVGIVGYASNASGATAGLTGMLSKIPLLGRLFGAGTAAAGAGTAAAGTAAAGAGGTAAAGAGGTAAAGATAVGAATTVAALYGAYVLVDWVQSVGELITNFDGKMKEVSDRASQQLNQGYFQNVLENLMNPGDAAIDLISGIGELGQRATGTGVGARGAQTVANIQRLEKETKDNGLTVEQNAIAGDEAGFKLKLEEAKASGDKKQEAQIQKDLQDLNKRKQEVGARSDNWYESTEEDTQVYKDEVAAKMQRTKDSRATEAATEAAKSSPSALAAAEAQKEFDKNLEEFKNKTLQEAKAAKIQKEQEEKAKAAAAAPAAPAATTEATVAPAATTEAVVAPAATTEPLAIVTTEPETGNISPPELSTESLLRATEQSSGILSVISKTLESIHQLLKSVQLTSPLGDQTTQESALQKLSGTSSTQGGLPAEIISLMDQKNFSTAQKDNVAKFHEENMSMISGMPGAGGGAFSIPPETSTGGPEYQKAYKRIVEEAAALSQNISGAGGGAFSIPPQATKGLSGIAGKGSDLNASAMDLFKRAKNGGAGDLSSMMSNNTPQADIEQYIKSTLNQLANPQPTTTGGPEAQKGYEQQVAVLQGKINGLDEKSKFLRAGGFEQHKPELADIELQRAKLHETIGGIPKPGPLTTTPVSPEEQAQAEEAKALLQKMQITGGSSPAVLQAAVQNIGQKQTTATAPTTGSAIVGSVVPPAMGPALPPANNRIDKFIVSAQSSQLGTSPGNTPPTSPSQPVAPAPAPTPADLKSKQVNSLKALQAARAKLSGLGKDGASFTDEDSAALEADVVSKDKEYKSATKEYGESQLSPANKVSREKNKLRANKEAAKKKLIGAQESQTNNMFSSFSGTSENGMKDYGLGDFAKVASAEKGYQSLQTSSQLAGGEKYKNKMKQNKAFGTLTKASGNVENLEREHADSLGMSYGDLLADKEKIGTFRESDKYKEAKQKEGDARLAYKEVKDLPTVGDDFDKSGHRKNAGYASMMSGRREAYLSKFRPEVREKMMTKGEKSERDLTQARATQEAEKTPGSNGPSLYDSATSKQLASVGPIPTSVPASQMSQQQAAAAPTSQGGGQNQGGPSPSYSITLDEASKQFLSEFSSSLNNFGSYIDQLSKIHIPDKIEMSHKGVVEVRVSGAAAFSALEEKMQKAINDAVSQKMEKIWNQSGGQLGDSPSMPAGKAATQV